MTDTTGRRTNPPADPTAERTSDPLPTGEDVIDRERPGKKTPDSTGETPRRYDQPIEGDPVLPSDDATLNTQI